MDVWKDLKDKKIFVILKNGRQYSGKVIGIDESSKPLIFISIIDIKDQKVTFLNSEIEVLEEEER